MPIPPFAIDLGAYIWDRVHHRIRRKDKLDHVLDLQLRSLAQGRQILMALSQAETNIITKFDAETTRIADLIRDLVANPPLDDEEFNAALTAIADRLTAVGSDPTTPIPPVE